MSLSLAAEIWDLRIDFELYLSWSPRLICLDDLGSARDFLAVDLSIPLPPDLRLSLPNERPENWLGALSMWALSRPSWDLVGVLTPIRLILLLGVWPIMLSSILTLFFADIWDNCEPRVWLVLFANYVSAYRLEWLRSLAMGWKGCWLLKLWLMRFWWELVPLPSMKLEELICLWSKGAGCSRICIFEPLNGLLAWSAFLALNWEKLSILSFLGVFFLE